MIARLIATNKSTQTAKSGASINRLLHSQNTNGHCLHSLSLSSSSHREHTERDRERESSSKKKIYQTNKQTNLSRIVQRAQSHVVMYTNVKIDDKPDS
jgi:hypothetical protein